MEYGLTIPKALNEEKIQNALQEISHAQTAIYLKTDFRN